MVQKRLRTFFESLHKDQEFAPAECPVIPALLHKAMGKEGSNGKSGFSKRKRGKENLERRSPMIRSIPEGHEGDGSESGA
jgi:hypothetical protein